MRIPYKLVVERFLESAFIIIMIVLLKTFFSGEVVFFSIKVFGLEIIGHKDGLLNGVLIGGRVISAVSVLVVLGFSMPFTQFIAALSWFKIPKGFLEILMFAGKYIFVIREEAEVIYGAQKNRLGYSNLKRSLNSFGVLAGSLTLKAFDHSQNSVAAMVQRGYNGNIPLSKHKPFKVAEVVGLLFCVTVMGLVWMV
jgi:cobalt/nickel transport system permease protein